MKSLESSKWILLSLLAVGFIFCGVGSGNADPSSASAYAKLAGQPGDRYMPGEAIVKFRSRLNEAGVRSSLNVSFDPQGRGSSLRVVQEFTQLSEFKNKTFFDVTQEIANTSIMTDNSINK